MSGTPCQRQIWSLGVCTWNVTGCAYLSVCFVFYLTAVSIRNTKDYPGPGNASVAADCLRNLKTLSTKTTLFPSLDQQMFRGPKIPVLLQLQKVSELTGTGYPTVITIPDTTDDSLFRRPDLIVKRGFSDGGKHVLQVHTKEGRAKFEKLVSETKEYYDNDVVKNLGMTPSWFGISFIPELRTKGELRVFFIGGGLSHIILSKPGDQAGVLKISRVRHVTPLDHLR
jgi:hypothetical protein